MFSVPKKFVIINNIHRISLDIFERHLSQQISEAKKEETYVPAQTLPPSAAAIESASHYLYWIILTPPKAYCSLFSIFHTQWHIEVYFTSNWQTAIRLEIPR